MDQPDRGLRVSSTVVRGLPLVVLGVAAAIAGLAVARQWSEVTGAVDQVSGWGVALSFAACLVGLFCSFRAWLALVTDTGEGLGWRQALRVYGIGQVGKYMPGGIWSIAVQSQMAREYGGSRLRIASASLVVLVLGVAVTLGMGSVLLPFSSSEAREHFWFTPLLAIGAVVMIAPPVLNRVSVLAGKALRRSYPMPSYSAPGVWAATGWLVLAHVFFGIHIQAIAYHFGVHGLRGLGLSTASYCLAVGLGLLFVPAPAGAGVREFVIVLVMSATMPTASALVVALIARLVAVAADFALGLSQVAAGRTADRQPVFLTRRFPPSVGGMETLAAGVWRSLQAARPDAVLIAHGGSNRALLGWLPRAWFRVAWLLVRGRAEVVLVGDAPTYAFVEPLLRLGRVRRAPMILGLDVSYPHPVYRALVLPALRRAPSVIAISEATRAAALDVGAEPERVVVVRLGVPVVTCSEGERAEAAAAVRERLGLSERDRLVLTLGRLVERKGARWFAGDVLPGLPANVHYLVAGAGPEGAAIEAAGAASGAADRLHLLGAVDEEYRELLLRGVDLFVQPNIPVPGDMEGFGLVTVESAVRGTPVVASALEGILDAVVDGTTGQLLPPGDVSAWTAAVAALLDDDTGRRELGRRYALAAQQRFGEAQMGRQICAILGIGSDPHERSRSEG